MVVDWPCKEPVRETDASSKLKLSCTSGAGFYMVVIDVAQIGADPDQIYDSNIDSLGKALKATVRTSTAITSNGLTGRETIFDVPGEHAVARTRQFVAWGQLYALTYYGPAGSENDKPAAEFFGSFRVQS